MVKVKLETTSAGEIVAFEVKGHSNYAEHGQDIVCSGISAIAQTAVLGLTHYLPHPPKLQVEAGYLSCSLPKDLTPAEKGRAEVILQTMTLGMEQIAQSYPKNLRLVRQVVET